MVDVTINCADRLVRGSLSLYMRLYSIVYGWMMGILMGLIGQELEVGDVLRGSVGLV